MKKRAVESSRPRCENCEGFHFGSPKGYCPYIKRRCVVCGEETIYACSDCAIDSGGKVSVHVCEREACQRDHNQLHPDRKPQDLMTHVKGESDGV